MSQFGTANSMAKEIYRKTLSQLNQACISRKTIRPWSSIFMAGKTGDGEKAKNCLESLEQMSFKRVGKTNSTSCDVSWLSCVCDE